MACRASRHRSSSKFSKCSSCSTCSRCRKCSRCGKCSSCSKCSNCSTCFVSVSSSSGSFLPNNLKTLTVKINMLLRKKNAFNNDNHLSRIMSTLWTEMFTLPEDRNTEHFEFEN